MAQAWAAQALETAPETKNGLSPRNWSRKKRKGKTNAKKWNRPENQAVAIRVVKSRGRRSQNIYLKIHGRAARKGRGSSRKEEGVRTFMGDIAANQDHTKKGGKPTGKKTEWPKTTEGKRGSSRWGGEERRKSWCTQHKFRSWYYMQ